MEENRDADSKKIITFHTDELVGVLKDNLDADMVRDDGLREKYEIDN